MVKLNFTQTHCPMDYLGYFLGDFVRINAIPEQRMEMTDEGLTSFQKNTGWCWRKCLNEFSHNNLIVISLAGPRIWPPRLSFKWGKGETRVSLYKGWFKDDLLRVILDAVEEWIFCEHINTLEQCKNKPLIVFLKYWSLTKLDNANYEKYDMIYKKIMKYVIICKHNIKMWFLCYYTKLTEVTKKKSSHRWWILNLNLIYQNDLKLKIIIFAGPFETHFIFSEWIFMF